MEYQDVGPVPEIAPGRAAAVRVDGVAVAVFRTSDGLRTVDDRCPHAGGPLHQGRCDSGVITCPWHAFLFDAATGACLVGADRPGVRSRAIRIEKGRLLIER